MDQAPAAWIFFVVYILVSSFVVLNLFIAVIVNALERGVTNDLVVGGGPPPLPPAGRRGRGLTLRNNTRPTRPPPTG
jgi:hypothetical protein